MQKRIRKFLQSMSFPSNVNVAIWEEGYRRWFTLIEGVTRPSSEDNDPSGARQAERRKTPDVSRTELQ